VGFVIGVTVAIACRPLVGAGAELFDRIINIVFTRVMDRNPAESPARRRRLNPVELAITRLKPATQAQLARLCGQRPQAVTRWLVEGKVPAVHALTIEGATRVPARRLCPSVFGKKPKLARIVDAAGHDTHLAVEGVSP
jgi:DNA-binding transcriptional regulator YdaS (Cro superfamily)